MFCRRTLPFILALILIVAAACSAPSTPETISSSAIPAIENPVVSENPMAKNEPIFARYSAAKAPQVPTATDASTFTEEVRIQIFPHTGRYISPQGRDTRIQKFTLSGEEKCHVYPAEEQGWKNKTDSQPVASERKIVFTETAFEYPVFVQCDSPPRLLREEGLEAFRYPGTFVIRNEKPEGDPSYLKVINVLDFETYIKGVVPSEMLTIWPLEALKAQAVAARTYATLQIIRARQRGDQDEDLHDTVADQAYTGLSIRDTQSDRAVDETKGQILIANGRVIKAFFHSNSGGHTEDSKHIFNEPTTYCKGKPETYDPLLISDNDWSMQIRRTELSRLLIEKGAIPKTKKLKKFEIDKVYPGLHVQQLKLTLFDGSVSYVSSNTIASVLGLKSTRFAMTRLQTPSGKSFIVSYRIHGSGYGNGVGLNQTGAKVLAQHKNFKYDEILNYYYTDVTLCGLNADTALSRCDLQ